MTSAVKLYEISAARDILDAWLNESEGELTPALQELLDQLDGQADEKIERVALYVRERLATAKAVKEEAERLQAIVKREEKAAESLKGYLKGQMERLGKAKVNGLLCTVAIQANSVPSVTCPLTDEEIKAAFFDNESPVGQFIREVPVSYRLDRDAVLQAFKAGDAIPDVIAVEKGTHLRIR